MRKLTTACLPDVAEIIMGQSPPGDTYNEANVGLPFFQGKTEFGEVSPTPRKWCNAPKKIAEAGDILISVRAPVGPTNLVSTQCCIGRGLAAIRANPEQLDPSYLRFALRHAEPRLASMGQGSTFAAIGRAELAKVEFPLPALVEQRRIVDILSRAEGIVRLRREAEKKAAELIPALFLDMFGDPATNPKGWRTARLGDMSEKMSDGPFGSNLKTSHYTDEGVRVIRLQNIGVGYLNDKERAFVSPAHFATLPRNHCVPGDVMIGTLGDPNLRAIVIPPSITEALNKSDCVQFRCRPDISCPEYICWLMNMPSTLMMAASLVQGITLTRISMGRLRELVVPIPPLAIQLNFAERVEQVCSIQSQQSVATATAQATFDALLAQVFN